jgi:hypothetical protein
MNTELQNFKNKRTFPKKLARRSIKRRSMETGRSTQHEVIGEIEEEEE